MMALGQEAPGIWTIGALIAVLAVLLATWRAADWRGMAADGTLHRFCAGALILALLWSARASIGHGLSFQLLGVPVVTLLLGPARAPWCAALGSMLWFVLEDMAIAPAIWHLLLSGVVPVLATELMRRAVAQWLPAHLFVYLLGVGFIGAGVVSMLAQALGAGLVAVTGTPEALRRVGEYLPFLLLIGFAEATLSGMLLTLAVVYRPAWVASFADRHYFRR